MIKWYCVKRAKAFLAWHLMSICNKHSWSKRLCSFTLFLNLAVREPRIGLQPFTFCTSCMAVEVIYIYIGVEVIYVFAMVVLWGWKSRLPNIQKVSKDCLFSLKGSHSLHRKSAPPTVCCRERPSGPVLKQWSLYKDLTCIDLEPGLFMSMSFADYSVKGLTQKGAFGPLHRDLYATTK